MISKFRQNLNVEPIRTRLTNQLNGLYVHLMFGEHINNGTRLIKQVQSRGLKLYRTVLESVPNLSNLEPHEHLFSDITPAQFYNQVCVACEPQTTSERYKYSFLGSKHPLICFIVAIS